ncbi:MAG TPA: aminotransferase class V-fold PLP-dependent enzyme [Gaiellaceae bacterium]|nr:aminotransferase class V-fold PLP-dependent enzyme [Gaiellaceae bacterium]
MRLVELRANVAPVLPCGDRVVGGADVGVEREDAPLPVEEVESLDAYTLSQMLEYRDRFPILADCTYLINHSLAAMPAAAEERLLEYARMWRERGIRSWGEGWWELPITVGDQIGRIVGAPPGSTVMHQNVTVAEEVVLSCFREPGKRNRIVYEEANFPSVRYLYQAKPDLEVVAVADDRAIVDAIDERTLLVPISHVLFKNAEIQDVAPIVERAHEAGAHVVLDCYQSAGVVPFDVTELDVDFAVGGSVKWLCGGPGAGWLYVRPDLAERLEPTFVGWQGHARPFAFEPELEYADGARRFLTGTPNVPALYAATAGYDVIEEVGVERIRARSLELTQLLIDELDAAGFELGSPREEERRGGTVLVRTPDDAAVHRELGERGIICDFRPDAGIRLGPHFYNTDDELRHTVGELANIVASGVYTRHQGAAARF